MSDTLLQQTTTNQTDETEGIKAMKTIVSVTNLAKRYELGKNNLSTLYAAPR
jgi:hypothetical protein